jgi:alpha-beta hydrolase superfamily lysophospholipase
MTQTTTRVDFPSEGAVTVAAYRWDPEGEPKAIAPFAHGVGEFALRYAALAERLAVALVAHGLGSFAAQQYLLDHSADVSAVVLSGTAATTRRRPRPRRPDVH